MNIKTDFYTECGPVLFIKIIYTEVYKSQFINFCSFVIKKLFDIVPVQNLFLSAASHLFLIEIKTSCTCPDSIPPADLAANGRLTVERYIWIYSKQRWCSCCVLLLVKSIWGWTGREDKAKLRHWPARGRYHTPPPPLCTQVKCTPAVSCLPIPQRYKFMQINFYTLTYEI